MRVENRAGYDTKQKFQHFVHSSSSLLKNTRMSWHKRIEDETARGWKVEGDYLSRMV